MTIRAATPYLFFAGTAARAITLYETALGARVTARMRYGDAPAGEHVSPSDGDRLMHAALDLGGGVTLLLSDAPASLEPPSERQDQSNVHINLDFADEADMRHKFDALARGGKVGAPIHQAFWGGHFGMLTDEFGINWMFTSTPAA
jgi:PhnB protein